MLIDHPDVNLANARRTHHEYYAPAIVESWWLRIFCAILLLAVLLLAVGGLRTAKQVARARVILLAAARDGSFDQVEYVNMVDHLPTDKEVQHFAYTWAVKYYSRVRATIAEDYPASLQFFAPGIVTELQTVAVQTHWVQEFEDSNDPEVKIIVKKVRLEKGSLTIDLDKHLYLSGREMVEKVENWTVQVPYQLLPPKEITNAMIALNPDGLQITAKPVETKGF